MWKRATSGSSPETVGAIGILRLKKNTVKTEIEERCARTLELPLLVRRLVYGGGLLESTYSRPQDCPTLNDEGSRTTPIKNIKLLNDRLEAKEQGNRSRFKRYEVLIELWEKQLLRQCHPLLLTVNIPVNIARP